MKRILRVLVLPLLWACGAAVAAPFAYIPHGSGVTVIDVADNTVVAEVPATAPRGWVGARPDTPYTFFTAGSPLTHLYRINTLAQSGSQLSFTERTHVAWNPVRTAVHMVRDNCEGGGACGGPRTTLLETFDADSLGITASVPLAAFPNRMVVNGAGTLIYLSTATSLEIHAASDAQRLDSIALGGPVSGIAPHPGLDRLYVTRPTLDRVDVLTRAGAAVGTIAVGDDPTDVAISPSGARLFVSNRGSNDVSVIDTATNQVIATVPAGIAPEGIDVAPVGDRVFVVNTGSGSVSVFAADDFTPQGTIVVGAGTRAIGRFIGGPTPAVATEPGILTGLWWNPAESGWGIHLTLRRNTVFAVLFTYDQAGAPRWYVSSNCAMNVPLPCPTCVEGALCNGRLFEASGPPFLREPFLPGAVHLTDVGLVQITFRDADRATIGYNIRSETRTVDILKQVFAEGIITGPNYTDLWWNPNQSGWGMGITHQARTLFLTWFVYDDSGGPIWYVASNCPLNAAGNNCRGTLYRASGHPGPQLPDGRFDPSRVQLTEVGHAELLFSDGDNALLTYTIDGVEGAKTITRQLF